MSPDIIREEGEALAALEPSGCEQRAGTLITRLVYCAASPSPHPSQAGYFPLTSPTQNYPAHPVFSQHLPSRSGQAPAGLRAHLRSERQAEYQALPCGPRPPAPAPTGRAASGQPATGGGFSASPLGEMEAFGPGVTPSGFQMTGSGPCNTMAGMHAAVAPSRFGETLPPHQGPITPRPVSAVAPLFSMQDSDELLFQVVLLIRFKKV